MECLQGMACCPVRGWLTTWAARLKTGRGLIAFDADDAAQAQCAVRGDPFVLEGLVEAQWLKEWTPASA